MKFATGPPSIELETGKTDEGLFIATATIQTLLLLTTQSNHRTILLI